MTYLPFGFSNFNVVKCEICGESLKDVIYVCNHRYFNSQGYYIQVNGKARFFLDPRRLEILKRNTNIDPTQFDERCL